MNLESVVVFVLVIIGILILLISEYKAHDCIPGKKCTHSVPAPSTEDSNLEHLDKIQAMVVNNYGYVIWRMALLTALIVTIPIVFFLKYRIPTLVEWLVIGGIVFLGTYLAFGWIWAHFFYPNGHQIEIQLTTLRDKIEELEARSAHSAY